MRIKYFPSVVSLFVREEKIKNWFDELSFIITDFVIGCVKIKYKNYIDHQMMKNVDEDEFFKLLQQNNNQNGTSAKRVRIS